MARKAARKTAGRSAKAKRTAGGKNKSKSETKIKVPAKANKAKAKVKASARPATAQASDDDAAGPRLAKPTLSDRNPADRNPADRKPADRKPPANPVLIEVTRGEMVESRHRVAVAVMDSAGKLVESWGDIEQPIYGRSAVKPFQALPLLETGAADHFGLGEPEIALACASHSGEPQHTDRVRNWLALIGCDLADLECGAHLPYHEPTLLQLIANGGDVTAIYNNCSGKHTGFLTTARHEGESTKGYVRYEHPVQQRVTRAMSEMTGLDLARAARGIDGCGIPVLGMPLRAMAHGLAKMADPRKLSADRADACRRIVNAIMAWPNLLGGSGRFGSAIMATFRNRFVLKGGAEGVYAGIIPSLGLGVAIKADDGAGRAAEAAMAQTLRRLKAISPAEAKQFANLLMPPVLNRASLEVGRIRSTGEGRF
jgi:L-asparaginase II